MKITCTTGRVDSSGRHNDRNFNVDKAQHIDSEKSVGNKYYVYNNEYEKSFTEVERDFYDEHFGEYLKDREQRNIASRHPSRIKTTEQYLHEKRTRPEDQILQIGDKDNHVSGEELWQCALEFKDRLEQRFGDNCKIIDMALHVDEATPHVHIRRAWIARDDNGVEYVNQNKALEQMGVREPDSQADIGRYNNAKISFTHLERQLFYGICKERGLEVDPPERTIREHLSVKEFKEQQIEAHIKEMEEWEKELKRNLSKYEKSLDPYQNVIERERIVDTREEKLKELEESLLEQIKPIEDFLSSPYFMGLHNQELNRLQKMEARKRVARLLKMFNKEMAQMHKTGNIEKDMIRYQEIIKERVKEHEKEIDTKERNRRIEE